MRYHQNEKLSPAVRVLSPEAKGVFKDTYLLGFLDLPEVYSEHDLQAGLIKNLCKFLLELGTGKFEPAHPLPAA